MKTIFGLARDIPVRAEVDVLVVGGGVVILRLYIFGRSKAYRIFG